MTGFQSKKLVARMMPSPSVISAPKFSILTTTTVDNSTWYTISCTDEVAKWIRETYADSNNDTWYSHRGLRYRRQRFDIHEKIYTMLSLRWQ